MTKSDVIDALSKTSGCEPKQVKMFLNSLTQVVEKGMKKGSVVPIGGLGKFRVVNRKARVGRNPTTGERIRIPAKTVVKFTVAKDLKGAGKKKTKRGK